MVMSNGWLTCSAKPSCLLGDLGGLLYELLARPHTFLLRSVGRRLLGGRKRLPSGGGQVTLAGLQRRLTAAGPPVLVGPIAEGPLGGLHDLYPPPCRLYSAARNCALRADHCPGRPPLPPALMRSNSCLRIPGLVYTPASLTLDLVGMVVRTGRLRRAASLPRRGCPAARRQGCPSRRSCTPPTRSRASRSTAGDPRAS